MTATTVVLTQTPLLGGVWTRGQRMEVIDDVLSTMRLAGGVILDSQFRGR